MGGSYSDLNIYFHTKKTDSYSDTGYTVNVTQENFAGCSDFVEFTHTIKFNPPGNGLNYNVLLYDGWSDKHKGNRVFGYYYPGNDNEVIQEVHTYYSVLAPNVPLVVSFKCHGNTYNCYFGDLKNAGWDRAYNISRYSFGEPLTKDHLVGEFKKLLLNKKIRFISGNEKIDIIANRQELPSIDETKNNKIFRFIFIPKGDKSVIGSDYLFSLNFVESKPKLPDETVPREAELCKRILREDLCQNNLCDKTDEFYNLLHNAKTQHKNKIDEYFLRPFDGQLYDGIIVYIAMGYDADAKTLCEERMYNKGMALVLEFIDSSKEKTYLKRMDKDGYWWSEDNVKYTDDKKLLEELNKIYKESQSKNVVAVIVDKKEKYEGVNEVKPENKKSYNKYTHKFQTANTSIILFARQKKTIGQSDDLKANSVEVYYLNGKDGEDKEPFLIVFNQDERHEKQNKKAYHFANEYNFEGWKEFNGGKIDGLDKKLKKIEDYGSCIPELSLLRWYAHHILIDKEIPATKPKDTPTPSRPDEFVPPDQPKPLSIPLIVGGSVGGVVFVVSSAVGYGIYWYNTTIKLLT